jgi:hypothetical protein
LILTLARVKTEDWREPAWSETVAVGGREFVELVKDELGYKALGRKIHESLKSGMNALRELDCAYSHDFDLKMVI